MYAALEFEFILSLDCIRKLFDWLTEKDFSTFPWSPIGDIELVHKNSSCVSPKKKTLLEDKLAHPYPLRLKSASPNSVVSVNPTQVPGLAPYLF